VYFIGINGKSDKDIFSTDQPIKIYEVENTPTEDIDQLPSPRNFKAIEINFTPRHFTTPSRESTKADEQEVPKTFCVHVSLKNCCIITVIMYECKTNVK